VELNARPTSFSTLIGTPVRDGAGCFLGRVYEVRARWEDDQIVVEELLVGRRGLWRRLRGPGPDARGIAWDSIAELGPDQIVVG
jgi:hypothetical protein